MKIETDLIRSYYTDMKGLTFYKAIGKADKLVRIAISCWINAGRSLIIVWGPPCAGKTTWMRRYTGPAMIVEASGLNIVNNKFYFSLPSVQVSYVKIMPPWHVCVARALVREDNPLSGLTSAAYLIQLIDKWYGKEERDEWSSEFEKN